MTKGKVFVVPQSFEVGVLVTLKPQQVVVAKQRGYNRISKEEVVTALVVQDKLEQDAALSKRGELEGHEKQLKRLVQKKQLKNTQAVGREKRKSDTASSASAKR